MTMSVLHLPLKLVVRHLSLTWLAIFVIGCADSVPLEVPARTATVETTFDGTLESPTTTVTLAPTNTAQPTPTDTLIPVTATPFPIPTPVSTLTLEERETLVQELMVTNGGCQLPCWWGVEMGDSLENVGEMFVEFGMPGWKVSTSTLGDAGQMGSIVSGYYNLADRVFYIDMSLNFHTVDSRVQYIRVSVSRPHLDEGKDEFVRDWQQYFLSQILQNYGKPSQVYVRLQSIADPSPAPIYSLSLLYLDEGISVTYNLKGVWLDENQLRGELCLEMENVNPLELSLFNPQYVEKWAYYFPPYDDELYEHMTWESQTGMGMDAFYEFYKDPVNLGCVQVQ